MKALKLPSFIPCAWETTVRSTETLPSRVSGQKELQPRQCKDRS